MAVRRKIRRKIRRKSPSVRAGPSTGAQSAKSEAKQSEFLIGGAKDSAETSADRLASKALNGGASGVASQSGGNGPSVHRSAASPAIAPGSTSTAAPKSVAKPMSEIGAGRGLSASERGYFEPRFGRDLGSVRVHEGDATDRAASAMDARAFATGNHIGFANGANSRATMAHELAHVVQDGGASQPVLRRDLAIEPANPDAVATVLTPQQRAAAMRYNRRRFEDPFTIRIIRDVFGGGISDVPAVIDDDFIDGTLQWQAERNLSQDGQFGPITTRTMVRELVAEGEGRLARLLRSDNFVRAVNISGPTFFAPPNPAVDFNIMRWDVAFRTSLRNGFIVQRVSSVWNENGAPNPRRIAAPTLPRYWEAWPVDGRGNITHPKHPTGADDRFQRAAHTGTSGNWSMTGRLYTVLSLPAVFQGPGGASHPPDAGGLQATINNPGSDNLGLPEGFTAIEHGEADRTVSGTWDVTNANPALHTNTQT